jgi:hypothetical protein
MSPGNAVIALRVKEEGAQNHSLHVTENPLCEAKRPLYSTAVRRLEAGAAQIPGVPCF